MKSNVILSGFLIHALFVNVLFVNELFAEVKMPAIFSDHMVLQSGRELPVWGTAARTRK